ncbi:hypothetical protein WMY93_028236 [Mugilogobius chulae]|uniref:Uncharacterized protein n=1 Tax=Mugilogobius chulae TaxID=88201 RepID=A0AAW0MY43_9GOBI
MSSTRGVQISCVSPGPALKQEIPETPQIKVEPEEQSIKQEEEPLTLCVPECRAVSVKTEESSLLQPNHTEPKEEQTQGEDISTEPHFHSETEGDTEHSSDTDNDEDWRAPLSCSDQVQTRGSSRAPQNSALSSQTSLHWLLKGLKTRNISVMSVKRRLDIEIIYKDTLQFTQEKNHSAVLSVRKLLL